MTRSAPDIAKAARSACAECEDRYPSLTTDEGAERYPGYLMREMYLLLREAADALEFCPICFHAWGRHDPEDGRCDAAGNYGECPCGRSLAWMKREIAKLSRSALGGDGQ